MRRIFFLLMVAFSALACTLSDDLMGSGSAPVPPVVEVDPSLMVSRAEDGAFTLGNPDAPITIIVFADWYCPHCQNYKPTLDRIIEAYVLTGKAAYEARILPTAGRENTLQLGHWAECAAESGVNYFAINNALYDLLFNGFQTAAQAQIIMEERFGLSAGKMADCLETANQVTIDIAFANKLGVGGTPSVFVRYANGRVESVQDRSFEGLSNLIENAGGEA
jgi:protein-disulfide isomerase